MFLVKKGRESEIRTYVLTHVIPTLENNYQMMCDGIDADIAGRMIGPTVVGTYAEVLKSQLGNKTNTQTSDPAMS